MSDASPESNTHILTLTMDWLAFTLPNVSAQDVMRQIGGEWSKGKAGFRGYPLSWILTDTSRGLGMLGTGAPRQPREVHADLSAGIVSPWDLNRVRTILHWIKQHDGHVTRIDCALDDRQAMVPLSSSRRPPKSGNALAARTAFK